MTSQARSPQRSATLMTELVLPQHTNNLGTVFGGQVLAWIDICGAVAAQRHCDRVAVTAAIDEVVFLAPIHQGDVVTLSARVNAAFRSSLEVEVRVEVEDIASTTRVLCVEALLVFVALDEHGKPIAVPKLTVENDDDAERVKRAQARRAARLKRRSR